MVDARRTSFERIAVLEAFIETSADAMVSLDPGGHILGWNRSAQRVFGYMDDEAIGAPVTMLFPQHLQGEFEVVLEKVVPGDRLEHYETEAQRKGGLPFPISLSVSPVVDGNEFVAFVLIARDITEQRLAQATLAEVEGRIRDAEAVAHVGTWLWDVRTGAVQWSDEMHRIHGVDPLDFEGTLAAQFACVDDRDRERVQRAMESSVVSGRVFDAEYRVARADGERRVHARAEPTIGSADDVVGLRGTAEDVTRRHPED